MFSIKGILCGEQAGKFACCTRLGKAFNVMPLASTFERLDR